MLIKAEGKCPICGKLYSDNITEQEVTFYCEDCGMIHRMCPECRNTSRADVAESLVKLSKEHKIKDVHFTDNEKIDEKIYDIENYPHLFVLSCLMDRQIKAERAWEIPYKVCADLCGSFEFDKLAELTREDIKNYFNNKKLHRYNDTMADIFCEAVSRIQNMYDGDASKIWSGNISSTEVVYRFLCFEGCGVKIATMAANLLYRVFGIQYSSYFALDVSQDIHVRRVLYRLGLIEDMDNVDLVIYRARDINPDYPGIIDELCWDIGRNYCHQTNPNCGECLLNNICVGYKGIRLVDKCSQCGGKLLDSWEYAKKMLGGNIMF